jgi:nucleolar protein 9
MKASNDGFQTFSELESRKADNGPRKTPLQLARERHVQVKSKQEQKERAALKGEERRGSRG